MRSVCLSRFSACVGRSGAAVSVFALRCSFSSSVDLALVRRLRQETKAGVMACRDALETAKGDYAVAKEAVLKTMKNREGKVMAEGLVAVSLTQHAVSCVEVACETDFVARGASLAKLAANAANAAADANVANNPMVDENALLSHVRSVVASELTEAARATGERLDVRRAWRAAIVPGRDVAASYLHAPTGQARVAAAVVLELQKPETAAADAKNVGQRLSVHVAGMKPASMAELLQQTFGALGAGSGTVEAELKKKSVVLKHFVRVEVGEGVEVKKEDYAESVQEVLKGKQ